MPVPSLSPLTVGRSRTPKGKPPADRFLLLVNAHDEPVKFTIPSVRAKWEPVLTTGRVDETPRLTARTVTLEARSLLLLHSS